MENPFQIIDQRLENIESLLLQIRHPILAPALDASPYGDFNWLSDTCTKIPRSTLRIKSASGEIPGVIKFGKRVLYDKAAVLNWLHSQRRKPALSTSELDRAAEEQVSSQLAKKGGKI